MGCRDTFLKIVSLLTNSKIEGGGGGGGVKIYIFETLYTLAFKNTTIITICAAGEKL